MNKLLSIIRNYLSSQRVRNLQKNIRKHEDNAKERIQMREWNGELYLSVNNVPIIPINRQGMNWTGLLNIARKTYSDYTINKEEQKHI